MNVSLVHIIIGLLLEAKPHPAVTAEETEQIAAF